MGLCACLCHEHDVGGVEQRVQRRAPRPMRERPRARPRVEEDGRAGGARLGHRRHDHRRRQLIKKEAVDQQAACVPQHLRHFGLRFRLGLG